MSPLAPLHNPANLDCIIAAEQVVPNAKHVAVFDTAYHQTMPDVQRAYAIPDRIITKYDEVGHPEDEVFIDEVKRYGFHGTSFMYILERVKRILNKEDPNLIIAHLGNGASMSLVKKGFPYNTTMGMSPLAGLVMGTRSGDIDPQAIQYIVKKTGMTHDQIIEILNKKSGLLGMSEHTMEMNVLKELAQKDISDAEDGLEADMIRKARRTIEVTLERLIEFLGSYMAKVDGELDALVLTAGIGENAWWWALELSKRLSNMLKDTRIMIIPTNEEVVFAREANGFVDRILSNNGDAAQKVGGIYMGDDMLEKHIVKSVSGVELVFDPVLFNAIDNASGVNFNIIHVEPILANAALFDI